jgi:LysR family transcriptional regulator, hypochlorite-specific transcription factor HypT
MNAMEKKLGPMSLRLMSYDGERCREAVSGGDCHFMISHFAPRLAPDFEASRLKSVVLATDTLIPVSAPDANGRPMAAVPGTPDARTPYLQYTGGSFMGRTLDLFFQENGAMPNLMPCFETSVAEGMKGMVLEGHGVGWLPLSLIKREFDQGLLVRAGESRWDLAFEVRLFRPTTRLPKTAEMLWNLVTREPAKEIDLF